MNAIAQDLVRAAVLGGLCLALCGAFSPPRLAAHRALVMAAVAGMVAGGLRPDVSILGSIGAGGAGGGGLVDALEPGAEVDMDEAFRGSTNPMPRTR